MRPAVKAGRGAAADATASKHENVLLRREIGEVLRSVRQHQGRTLREVSGQARVSLGYLSEVERGPKEASSELLASICHAVTEGVTIPDTVPDELVRQQGVPLR